MSATVVQTQLETVIVDHEIHVQTIVVEDVQATLVGLSGTNGKDGRSVLQGVVAPNGTVGIDGDVYVDTVASKLYVKNAGVWSLAQSLVGATGPKGDIGLTGAKGDTGNQGIQGIQGNAGVNGLTVRSGSGAPAAGLGVNGDFYINTAANTIYGPKASGAWGAAVSIVGPQGVKGDTGLTGATGADSIVPGPKGDTGAAGTTDFNALTNKPTLGTASPLDVALSGDASAAQAVKGNDTRLTNARSASDVYAWAKGSTKPVYAASEIAIADAGGLITATTVEAALQENRTAINLNTAKVTNATHTGEVTGSGALTIAAKAVTYAKMQDVSGTDHLLGRSSAGAGVVEEIACTAAGRAILDDATAAAQLITLGAVATTDTRLSNARTPVAHNQAESTITNLLTDLAGKAPTSHSHTKSQITDMPSSLPASDVSAWAKAGTKPSYAYSELTSPPTLGTAAAKNIPAAGNASATEVVYGSDTRLANARNAADVSAWAKAGTKPSYTNTEVGAAATSHSHAESEVTNLTTDLAGKAPLTQPINAQSGTTYAFVLGDAGDLVTFGSASATTVTIPTNASVAFPIGTHIDCMQIGTGKVTFAGTGVTINSKASNKSIGAQWVGVTLVKTATDTWSLLGDLVT